MREIKFRVWDMYEKKFTRIFTLDKFNGIKVEHLNDLSWSRPYLVEKVFQQYTGLTDRNGQEIYEGDVVEYYISEDGPETATVVFENGVFWAAYPLYEVAGKKYHCGVIGNIFEGVDK